MMKNRITFALAMLLAVASTALTAAPAKEKEAAPAAETEAEGPTPAQLKARKAKVLKGYRKFNDAKKVAEAANQPILAFIFIEQSPVSELIEKKLLTNKLVRDELIKDNAVLLTIKLKRDLSAKDPKDKGKKVDLRPLKEPERKLVENFGLDEKAAAQAKKNDKEITYADAVNYPAIIGISPDGMKQLFRMGSYDKDGGMGVWISTVVDTLRTGGIEPVISPKVQKVLDNPDDPKKWK